MNISNTRGRGRPRKAAVRVVLPLLPLSVEYGRDYLAWRADAEACIRRDATGRVPGLCSVRILGSGADAGRSWPALLVPITQCLVDAGLIDGVCMVGRVATDWLPEGAQGVLTIEIKQLSPPTVRHRLVATRGPRQQPGAAA